MAISTVTRAAIARIWEQRRDPATALLAPISWWTGDLDEVRFLERLYPLDDMLSSDDRYPDARADIIQHCLNNDAWHGCGGLKAPPPGGMDACQPLGVGAATTRSDCMTGSCRSGSVGSAAAPVTAATAMKPTPQAIAASAQVRSRLEAASG